MSILANCSILNIGMGMAFPSVSIQAMTNAADDMALEEHEFSWFGMYNTVAISNIVYKSLVCVIARNKAGVCAWHANDRNDSDDETCAAD